MSNDYISKYDAYFVLTEYYSHKTEMQHRNLREALNRVPPANVRPAEEGHWILHISNLFPADSTIECDKCHAVQPIWIDVNFCPNCGSKMRDNSDAIAKD